ncbi:hypothetical protein ES707_16444 [subsurface metagenome]
MIRWISWVLPPARLSSRGVLVVVERGSMAYSAVIQPFPSPLRKVGTRSSTVTAQITLVCPSSMSADPSA